MFEQRRDRTAGWNFFLQFVDQEKLSKENMREFFTIFNETYERAKNCLCHETKTVDFFQQTEEFIQASCYHLGAMLLEFLDRGKFDPALKSAAVGSGVFFATFRYGVLSSVYLFTKQEQESILKKTQNLSKYLNKELKAKKKNANYLVNRIKKVIEESETEYDSNKELAREIAEQFS